ncbi:MAG: alpha/beta hydrolase family protein [Flavobacteriia bacterium]
MKSISLFFLILPFFLSAQIDGTWHAAFSVMGTTHRMDLVIHNNPGDQSVFLSDPDSEKLKDVKMDKVLLSDSTVSFHYPKIGLSFKGNYYRQGDSIQGVMSQMDIKWGATFYREIQEKIVIKRPQEPKPPFAYPNEELTIKNGGFSLGATLTLPKNSGNNFPIVVLASGSGPQDRDCDLLGHKTFLVIADYFARNGIGCLRFDDRGTGKSSSVYNQASLKDLASDVKACVTFLSNDPRFANNPIGIAGHSEGGMHALMASVKNKDVCFIIELASVGTGGREVLVEQQYLIPLKSGKSEEYAAWNRDLYAGVCALLSTHNSEKIVDPLNAFLDEHYQKAPEEYKAVNNPVNFKLGMHIFLNNDWVREFIDFEAKDYLKRLKIPILAINGAEDIQVPPVSNSTGFDQHFSKKSRTQSKTIILPELNHLLQPCETCTIMEYGENEITISEDVLMLMRDWINGLKK